MLTIMASASTAGALAWVTVTAEDAPELLKSAPISAGTLLRYKLQAALLPVLPIILLPLIALGISWPWYGLCVTVCSAGSALTAALLNADDTRVGNRRDFRTRYKGSFGRAMLGLLSILLWYALCALLIWLDPFG
jgi:ABC-2 type transport system permease protein